MSSVAEAKRDGFTPIRRSYPKFGYQATGEYPRTLLVPEPREASVVRGIFMMAASGASATQIAARIKPGVHERFPGGKRGRQNHRYVRAIVQDVAYEGYVRVDGRLVPARHEPLVGEDLAVLARRRLKASAHRVVRREGYTHRQAREAAFRDGYWVQSPQRPYGTLLQGEAPRFTLVTGPGLPEMREVVDRLASGEDVVEVELWVQANMPPPAKHFGWRRTRETWDPQRLGKLLKNPGYRGLTQLRGQVQKARWAPFFDLRQLETALARLEEEKARRRRARPSYTRGEGARS